MIVDSTNRAYSRPSSGTNIEVPRTSSANIFADIVLLVLLGILSYGLLISSLGYYWDDWRILLVGSKDSSTNILENYAYRPGTAWLFNALYRYVGTNYSLGHWLALAMRVACSLAFWRVVRLVWPSYPALAFASAALFLVYPGFTQQSISLTYENYHVSIFLCLLSLLATLERLRAHSLSFLYILLSTSLILQLGYLVVLDGLIAWEVMRWALIVVVAARCSGSKRIALKRSIGWMFPYVATITGFVLWRGFWVRATRDDANFLSILRTWRSMPFRETAIKISGKTMSNFLDSSIFAWPVQAWRGAYYDDKALLAGLFVGALGAALFYLRLSRWPARGMPTTWSKEFLFVGGVSLLAISIFHCVVNKNVRLDQDSDRFAYPASAASVFLVVGLSGFALGRRASVRFVTVLIGLSILSNFSHAYQYRAFWRLERSLSWQLAWRAPEIEPGSLVVFVMPRLGHWPEDLKISHDLNAPLNLHYTNSEAPLIGLPLGEKAIEFMKSVSDGRREEVLEHIRYITEATFDYMPPAQMQGPPGVLLMFLGISGATLRTVDPDHLEELPAELPSSVLLLAKYARVGVIRGSGPLGVPTAQLVGAEPPHTWAWYFQRAELARQLGDYKELSALLADVHAQRLAPADPSEWLVFLEAAIRAKQDESASRIIQEFRARYEYFLPRVKTWLNNFLMRSEGSEQAVAASLLKKVE